MATAREKTEDSNPTQPTAHEDAAFKEESSEVRANPNHEGEPDESEPQSKDRPSTSAVADPVHEPAESRRSVRIAEKAEQARLLIDSLPADNGRARLLQVALLRQDEALLDGLLEQLRKS